MNDVVILDHADESDIGKTQERLPVLIVAVGRGRVGKTTFLNILGQRYRERGAKLEIWNIDTHGETGAIDDFFPDVRRPAFTGVDDRQKWLEEVIAEQAETRCDALLDVGGGDLVLPKMMKDLNLGNVAETMRVRVVVVQLVGPVAADLDHFDLDAVGSGPNLHTIFVMNAGLVVGDVSPLKAFEHVVTSPVVKSAVANGGVVTLLPHLVCLDTIVERRMTFSQAGDRKRIGKIEPLSVFDAARVRKWWTVGLNTTFDRLPPLWLPAIPEMTSESGQR
jgi:hypothetical protein